MSREDVGTASAEIPIPQMVLHALHAACWAEGSGQNLHRVLF